VRRLNLDALFGRLFAHYGPQHWWPADSPFEVVVGAILTQNTAWSNVEKAIANLRDAGPLTSRGLAELPLARLEALIRPAGFFRQKASRLQQVAQLLEREHAGDVAALCAGELEATRARLLALHGIGPETADSILLYAAARPSFVVDAYTRRLLERLGLLAGGETYEAIRRGFMEALPDEPPLYNEYHALIVVHCKDFCRKRRPRCGACPLAEVCPAAATIWP